MNYTDKEEKVGLMERILRKTKKKVKSLLTDLLRIPRGPGSRPHGKHRFLPACRDRDGSDALFHLQQQARVHESQRNSGIRAGASQLHTGSLGLNSSNGFWS